MFYYSFQGRGITVCSKYFQQRFCVNKKSLVSFEWDLNVLLTAGVQPALFLRHLFTSAGWKRFDREVKRTSDTPDDVSVCLSAHQQTDGRVSGSDSNVDFNSGCAEQSCSIVQLDYSGLSLSVCVCVCVWPTCAVKRWGRRCCTAVPSLPVRAALRGSEPSAPGGEDKYASRSGSTWWTLPWSGRSGSPGDTQKHKHGIYIWLRDR